MLKTIATAALLSVALATPAWASQCPNLMNEVDAAMEASPPQDAQLRQQVQDLRTEGEALHKAGKHAASEETFKKALEMIEKTKG